MRSRTWWLGLAVVWLGCGGDGGGDDGNAGSDATSATDATSDGAGAESTGAASAGGSADTAPAVCGEDPMLQDPAACPPECTGGVGLP